MTRFYGLNFDKVMEYMGISEDELGRLTLDEAYSKYKEASKAEEERKAKERLNDESYVGIVKRFSEFYAALLPYCRNEGEEASLLKIIGTHVLEHDIVTEKAFRNALPESKRHDFLREGRASMHKIDRYGRELTETEYVHAYFYRMHNQYENTNADKVISSFLKELRPQYAKYSFQIYGSGLYDMDHFEIYLPVKDCGSLYVPFKALMEGDADAIIERNRSYREWYNHKPYDLETFGELMKADTVTEFLETVRNSNSKGAA